MSREEFGLWLFVGTVVVCAAAAYLLVHVFAVEWFRVRLQSSERWTRAIGMLPIAFPAYLVASLIFRSRYP